MNPCSILAVDTRCAFLNISIRDLLLFFSSPSFTPPFSHIQVKGQHIPNLGAAGRASNESSIRVLTSALASAGVLDAVGAVTSVLAVVVPEESPAVVVRVGHLG